jgi:A nuclease of the HNH/ENDO VII superfamily with conserved WHH
LVECSNFPRWRERLARANGNNKKAYLCTINGHERDARASGERRSRQRGEFKSNNLTGTGSATSGDFLAANKWAASNPALVGKFRLKPGSQRCEVKFGDDWIECTWHHVQDGRTMYPVPSVIHDAFKHTGGKAIIDRGLQDIFTY